MQPNQLPPAPPPMLPQPGSGPNPYDFMSTGSGPTRRLPSGSKTQRIIFAGIGLVVLVIIVAIFATILSGSGKDDSVRILDAAKEQSLLLQISDLGMNKSKDQAAKNIAVTARTSIASQQASYTAQLKAMGIKFSNDQLAAPKNSQASQLLTEAERNNQFDEAFLKVLKAALADYQQKLQAADAATSSAKLKSLITEQLKSTVILSGAIPAN